MVRAGAKTKALGSGAPFGLASSVLMVGLIGLSQIAPLSAQGMKSLVELLTFPQEQDLPPLARAEVDGTLLAGKPILAPVPRVTLAAHRGEKLAPTDPQRIAAASPDIIVPPRIEGDRLAFHFLTTENAADRAVLEGVFAGKIPDYFKNIEPAANAPKVDFVKPGALATALVAAVQPPLPQAEGALSALLPPVLAAFPAPDGLKLANGYLTLPPPPINLVAVAPETLTAVKPERETLSPNSPPALAAVTPPTIKGQPVVPEGGAPIDPTVPLAAVVPQLTGKDLNKAIQVELKRLNCMSGKADGSFGKGSQGALDLFFKTSGVTAVSADLTQGVLDQLKTAADKTCPAPYAAAVAAQAAAPTKKPAASAPAKPAKAPAASAPAKPAKPAKPAATSQDPCVKDPASCMSFN